MIDSFPNRIKACTLLAGETLNGKKKLIQKFKTSNEDGFEYIQKRNIEIESINNFISDSNLFFSKLSRLDLTKLQCNQANCSESIEICKIHRKLKKLSKAF